MERLLKTRLIGGKFTVSAQRSQVMRAVRGSGNRTTEMKLRMALVRAGVAGWVSQRSDLPGKPDFYFEAARLAVFVDGCFWHGCGKCGHIPKTNREFWAFKLERNRQRHREVAALLKRKGIGVIRLWEHQLQSSLEQCVVRIQKHIGKRDTLSQFNGGQSKQ